MKKIAIVFAALLLSACASGPRNAAPTRVYDFGMPAPRLAADPAWSRLAIEIKAPRWLDSPSIAYRLAYDDSLRLREYAGSRWAGAPAQLLGQRLQQQLGTASPTGNAAVDCLLRLDLQEFSQVFDSPQASRGVLQVELGLFDARRQRIAVQRIVVERPAPTLDAQGGAVALVAASDELGKRIADWLDAPARKALACRAGAPKP